MSADTDANNCSDPHLHALHFAAHLVVQEQWDELTQFLRSQIHAFSTEDAALLSLLSEKEIAVSVPPSITVNISSALRAQLPLQKVIERLLFKAGIAASTSPEYRRVLLQTAFDLFPCNPDILLAWSWQLFDDGRTDEALHCLQKIDHAVARRFPEYIAAEAWFLLAEKRLNEARNILTRAIADFPDHAALHWYHGLLHFNRRDLDPACSALQQALRINPNLDEAAVTLAWVLHDLKQFRAALHWSRYALRKSRTPDRLCQLGWLLLCLDQPRRAAIFLAKAIRLKPDLVVARLHLAHTYERLKQVSEAKIILAKGTERLPADPDLLLAQGWLHHRQGEIDASRMFAEKVIENTANCARAWHLLGVIWETGGEWKNAEQCLSEAVRLDPDNVDSRLCLARVLRQMELPEQALATLNFLPGNIKNTAEAIEATAQLLLDLSQPERARNLLLPHLHHNQNGMLWYLLGTSLLALNKPEIATLAFKRTSRLLPAFLPLWHQSAWAHLQCGRIDAARHAIETLLKSAPGNGDLNTQAAFLLEQCNDLPRAQACVELAVTLTPKNPETWRALGQILYRQQRFLDAVDALQIALSLHPNNETACKIYRQIGWVAIARHQFAKAEAAFLSAFDLGTYKHSILLEIANTRRCQGRFADAAETIREALRLKPDWAPARLLQARILAEWGEEHHAEAARICALLVIDRQESSGARELLIDLCALGNQLAKNALRLLERVQLPAAYLAALEFAQGRRGHKHFLSLSASAEHHFPDDAPLSTARFYAASLDPLKTPQTLAREARCWYRQLSMRTGSSDIQVISPAVQSDRLRIAYIASHVHHSLLAGVIAAHKAQDVQIFLYAGTPELLGRLPQNVVYYDLQTTDLETSVKANRIDVVINTVGIHPFVGQMGVIQALARRLAPVQCAWLGSWGSSGGLYDALITDEIALPASHESFYAERIVRIPDGQWHWTPPPRAAAPGPLPCWKNGYVTFGSSIRGFRLTSETLAAWSNLLAALPGSRLLLIGHQSEDWHFRSEFASLLHCRQIDPERVEYRPYLRQAEYFDYFLEIDIALDGFPGNGGLCLLDALWMGVPVVSRMGQLLGERQGASILTMIGHPEWICNTDESYVATTLALACNQEKLGTLRSNLRNELSNSPLTSADRVATALENICRTLRAEAQAIASAASPKELSRMLARRSYQVWKNKNLQLNFGPHRPLLGQPLDLSVVIVLFNQVGLSLQTLLALIDQTGAKFEVIIVDNGSTDETSDLLSRINNATIIRNPENVGFLLAANQGAARATGRHLLFLNNDAIAMPNALREGICKLDADSGIGAVGARIVLGSGKLQEAGCMVYQTGSTQGYGRGKNPCAPEFAFERDVDFCSGAFLMVRRSLWEALGGFDERYVPAYYEDTDFCLRVWQSGFRVIYHPNIWISHLEWGSSSSAADVGTLMDRNRQKFVLAHQRFLQEKSHPVFGKPILDRWLMRPQPRVLVIDNAVPHTAIGGGLPRARSLTIALAKYHVTLFPLWTLHEDWREVYTSLPATVEVMLEWGAAKFERFMEERIGVYDVMLISRPPNMEFVDALWRKRPELFEGLQLIYDAEAVFALRDIGKAKLHKRPFARQKARALLAAELNLAKRAKIVLAVSRLDAVHFRASGAEDVRLLSHSMVTRRSVPMWAQRNGLLFIGALHPDTPNEDGLLWFVTEVFPLLEGLLGETPILTIIGECRSPKIAELHGKSIQVIGRIDDLTPYYDKARVFIAPTRYAAGIPTKIIEAACQGIPVVASEMLVRQLGWKSGKEIRSAVNAISFAEHIVDLYCKEKHWLSQLQAAQDKTEEVYSPKKFDMTVHAAIQSCVAESKT